MSLFSAIIYLKLKNQTEAFDARCQSAGQEY